LTSYRPEATSPERRATWDQLLARLDGRTLGGVTLVNPFASPRFPLLARALGGIRSSPGTE